MSHIEKTNVKIRVKTENLVYFEINHPMFDFGY